MQTWVGQRNARTHHMIALVQLLIAHSFARLSISEIRTLRVYKIEPICCMDFGKYNKCVYENLLYALNIFSGLQRQEDIGERWGEINCSQHQLRPTHTQKKRWRNIYGLKWEGERLKRQRSRSTIKHDMTWHAPLNSFGLYLEEEPWPHVTGAKLSPGPRSHWLLYCGPFISAQIMTRFSSQ